MPRTADGSSPPGGDLQVRILLRLELRLVLELGVRHHPMVFLLLVIMVVLVLVVPTYLATSLDLHLAPGLPLQPRLHSPARLPGSAVADLRSGSRSSAPFALVLVPFPRRMLLDQYHWDIITAMELVKPPHLRSHGGALEDHVRMTVGRMRIVLLGGLDEVLVAGRPDVAHLAKKLDV